MALSKAGALFSFLTSLLGDMPFTRLVRAAHLEQARTCTLEHLYGCCSPFLSLGTSDACRAAWTHASHNHHQEQSPTDNSRRQRVAFLSIIRSYVIALLNRCSCLQLHARGRKEHDMACIEIMTRRAILECCYRIELPYMEEYREAIAVFWERKKENRKSPL